MRDYLKQIDNEYKDKKIVVINCLDKLGFNDLFETIYNEFKEKKIEAKDFKYDNIKDIEEKLKESFFFKNNKLEDIISQPMKKSVEEIKTLILLLTGQYRDQLNKNYYYSFLFRRIWNYIKKKFL